jgi:hypothetical protein
MNKAIYLFAFLIACSLSSVAQRIDHKRKGAPMPPFLLAKPGGGTVSNAQLRPGSPVMIMIFSPQCDHCETIIDSLKNLAPRFSTTQLVLVAEDRNKDLMKDFVQKTGIGKHPLFQRIGTDKGNLIFNIYTNKLLPQVNIYDKSHRLVQTLDGNFPLDSLKMFIQ